jgi:adenylate cyclase class 2
MDNNVKLTIMMEIEVKVKADLEEVEKRLVEGGANFVNDERQIDTYYNAPHRDFAETDEALRLRSVGRKSTLTYKGPRLDALSKSRNEITLSVSREPTQDLLASLGFSKFGQVTKFRRNYRLGDLLVSLDDVKTLGTFMEIEAVGEEKDFEFHEKKVVEALKTLGFGEGEIIRGSYLELVYGKQGREVGHKSG